MQDVPTRRVVVDVSTLLRWTGPPVGIVRTQHELAMHARSERGEAALCFWDKVSGKFRALNPSWAPLVLGWHGAIDTAAVDVAPSRRGFRRLILSRQPIVMALERLRLTTQSAPLARLADRLQRAVLAPRRHKFRLDDAHGRRLACVPSDFALGEELSFGPGDVVLLAGNDWYYTDPAVIGALKQRLGFDVAVMCYDLIPLAHPEFFPAADVALFRRYWSAALPIADLVIFNASAVQANAHAVAAELGTRIKASAVVKLGFHPPEARAVPCTLPGGLVSGRYAVFVSTIEPRKGHGLLLHAWKRLLARGIPQRHGFRLVFVGRPGWSVDEVLRQIDAVSRGGTLLHLRDIGDVELDALYRGAAFCLYPSRDEGFGLPIIEAFARGKAVITSTGGAVPETVGDLAPCLDPTDAAPWEESLAEWIEQPGIRAGYEARIRDEFSHPTWAEAAANILELASRAGQQMDDAA